MSTAPDLRSRKRLATRQSISNAATRLFLKRGFDQVTVDDIAAAADVGRMTVFNHFARKEDMFLDRYGEVRGLLRKALLQRDPGTTPIEAYRLLAHRLAAEPAPFVEFSSASKNFINVIENSETLKARVRAMRDELARVVAAALAESAGREAEDTDARLAANLLLATWSVALIRAHGLFRKNRNAEEARAAFLVVVDQGSIGVTAAMAGTPYA
ncbi:MAG: TetR/AcrR family transcriptional regulator [Gallionellaceae bacterium]|jgi:AcrR family transcriptional regulator|nr:TetR/AcrR family transcriptional regulator [Gallionellaceae bacterium]